MQNATKIPDFERITGRRITDFSEITQQGNNQLYKIVIDGIEYVFKQYSDRISASLNKSEVNWGRGRTEFEALSYLWKNGYRDVPRPFAFYEVERAALYSFEAGEVLPTSKVQECDVDAAADFLIKLHKLKKGKDKFPLAVSACLSLGDYVAVLDRRIEKIGKFELKGDLGLRARRLVEGEVIPALKRLKADFYRNVNHETAQRQLPLDEQVLTPADFGFHNILVNGGEYVFLDFEYFGRDDPARQILDFLHHDKSREIEEGLKRRFLEKYERENGSEAFRKRVALVDPLVGMCWVLIYLNVLSADYLSSAKISPDFHRALIEERLFKAEEKSENLNATV
jgi:thiamine kinase-like enzyme